MGWRFRRRIRLSSGLSDRREQVAGGIDDAPGIHLGTPDAKLAPTHEDAPIPRPAPEPFRDRSPGILGRVWAPRRERIDRENAEGRAERAAAITEWEEAHEAHRRSEILRRHRFQSALAGSPVAMEALLAERLLALPWPGETSVSLEVRDSGSVWLDVELADKFEAEIHGDQVTHVHGVLFRLVGECFHALPTLVEVVASGYTQRPDPATSHLGDVYLLSVRVTREQWEDIDFADLEAIDVVAAFEPFELRRDFTEDGPLRPIEPLAEGGPLPP